MHYQPTDILTDIENAAAGHDLDHHVRTPEDDRARRIFWFVVFPMFYAGLGIIAWSIYQTYRWLVG